MAKSSQFYSNCYESFQEIAKPKEYLEPNERLSSRIKEQLKQFYDFSKGEEVKSAKSNALPELIVQNFDLEQIWQQLELQNEPLLTRSFTNVSKLVAGKNQLLFKNLERFNEKDSDKKESRASDQLDNDEEKNQPHELESDNVSFDEDELSDEDDASGSEEAHQNRPLKSSVVDDDFFKLDEMENFLRSEEKKLNEPDSGNDSEDSESASEESVDLFEAGPDDEDEEVKTARYKDFFVPKEETRRTKRNKFLEERDRSDSEDEVADREAKSSFESRQERLTQRIGEIEENAVGDKPWQLKGEITAEGRPKNSLLEEVVEFDFTARPALVTTEQTYLQIEDIIKQRIKDKAFDSVERTVKPVETPLEYKKKLVLDQEKSKESLAQIYEKDYLEQKAALDPENQQKEEEEPQLHKEINTMVTSLFSKLDALSNFHFTPKPAIPELRIVSNLPALTVEEVAPIAMSDAALLAPEEVKKKMKGDLIGKNERTSTDKKRERRKKKRKQKVHLREKEKKEQLKSKLNPGLENKPNKDQAKKMLEKVTRNKNVEKMDESGGSKSLKSSSAFFAKLEEDLKSKIKSKIPNKRKMNTNAISAKKLKL